MFAQAKITIEIQQMELGEAIPVTKTREEPPLPVWAPKKFPADMPKELVAAYPQRPRDVGEIPPFFPRNVKQWRTIFDAGPQRTREAGAQGDAYEPIPIIDEPEKRPGNEKELQAALDDTMKKVEKLAVNAELAAINFGSAPTVVDALNLLSTLTQHDLSRATGVQLKSPWADDKLISRTAVVLYHSVFSVVLDKEGEPYDLGGWLEYPILVAPPGSQMQRNLPQKGVYVSVQQYGDGNFRLGPGGIKKVLFGGVGSFIEYGYGYGGPHELQRKIQTYLDWYKPSFLVAISVSSAFKREELSKERIKLQIPILAERTLGYAARDITKRLRNDFENYEQFLASLAKDLIRTLITDKIRDEVIEWIVKKLGTKVIPLVNLAFAAYEILEGEEERKQVRHALAAVIMGIKGTEPDDMTIASKVLGKIASDRIYEKLRQSLINQGAKAVKHAAGKVRPKPPPEPSPEPPPEPTSPEPTAPPPEQTGQSPTGKPQEPAIKPLTPQEIAQIEQLQAAQKKQQQDEHPRATDAKGKGDAGVDKTATEHSESEGDQHRIGVSLIRGHEEESTATAHSDTDAASTATGSPATNNPGTSGQEKLTYSGKPTVPRSTGGPFEFQSHIDAPERRSIGGASVRSRDPNVLIGARREHHREDVAKVIAADPNHPMRAMLDPQSIASGTPRFVTPPYVQGNKRGHPEDWARHPEHWESGHMRTGHMGDADVLVVQSKSRNQEQNYRQETGRRGEVTHDEVVVIGGVAVEGATAWDLWHAGYIDLSHEQMEALPRLKL